MTTGKNSENSQKEKDLKILKDMLLIRKQVESKKRKKKSAK